MDNDPPVVNDFATHWETQGGDFRRPHLVSVAVCQVFRQMRDALHQKALMPRLGTYIARATLRTGHGKTKTTSGMQPSHTSWTAPFEGVDRAVFRYSY